MPCGPARAAHGVGAAVLRCFDMADVRMVWFMIEAAGPFDDWGSSLIGGVGGAAIAVAAVFVAQWLTDRRKAADERRNAANDLIIEISNLRDDASSRRKGLIGDYALFPLRNALFVTHVALEKYPSYHEVQLYYRAVRTWREWARDHKPPNPPSTRRPDAEYEKLRAYQAELHGWAEDLINVLQDHLFDMSLNSPRRPLPGLPE